MSKVQNKLDEMNKRFAALGLEPHSPRERVYIMSCLMGAEESLKVAELALEIETQVHKRVEEAMAKAYVKE